MKHIKKLAVLIFVNLAILAVLLEVVARLLPVQESTGVPQVNESSPYIHVKPNAEIVSSFGPRLRGVTTKRSNNYGYFSDFDYVKNAKPDVVIIGDSYVEAMQVSNNNSITGQINNLIGTNRKVYNIGFSGSPLSQYLAFSQFAKSEFEPQNYVFVIIGNDFDESLLAYKSSPGYFYYNSKDELELVEYFPSALKEIARNSAFLRYLFLNLHAPDLIKSAISSLDATEYHGNTIATANNERVRLSKHAIDLFIHDVKELLGTKDVLFVLDGDRGNIYTKDEKSRDTSYYPNKMFEYFKERSSEVGFETLDLQPIFFEHFQTHKARFESEYDAHWNELGHKVAAEAVFKRLFGSH